MTRKALGAGGILLLLVVVPGALPGCSSNSGSPPAPQPLAPPAVAGTQPAARSTGVPYDTGIQVQFSTPMNAATLVATNVFLKQDTRRVPIALQWDAATLRLRITPGQALDLLRTYTVEFAPAVLTAEGASFGPNGWFFQFTTNGLRRPIFPRPAAGTVNESPFVMLSWDSTEAGLGPIQYQVWSGADSAAVALRSGLPTTTTSRAGYLPTARWPLGSRIFWSITAINGATGEHLDGGVQRFDTLPASTAVDSIWIPAADYAWNSQTPTQPYPIQNCASDSIVSQIGFQCWLQFALSALPADVHLAEARLEASVYDQNASRINTGQLTLWSSSRAWLHPCKPGPNYPSDLPVLDLVMAPVRGVGGSRVVYSSDLLASHVEASVRRGGFYGYLLTSIQRIAYVTPHLNQPDRAPYLKLYYFRTPPNPALSVAP